MEPLLFSFENIMDNGAFAPKSKCSILHNIFKYMIFQRRQKAFMWSKGLIQLSEKQSQLSLNFKKEPVSEAEQTYLITNLDLLNTHFYPAIAHI